ncbi:HNH endonuclease [Pedobacter sp. P26]|uniref:HNH endonuclease n=1 Tax=Pedobacter sp. P26 TaxID=3423956 RepID=UPI003D6786EF
MNYWWVNHKQTYKAEVGGGYIWSPIKNKNNSANKSYTNLTETNIGDVIFSYAGAKIKAIGIIRQRYSNAPVPEEFGVVGEQWSKDGYLVKIDWEVLNSSFKPKDFIDDIKEMLPSRYSPLQQNGNGNQGIYLAQISAKLGEKLIEIINLENTYILPDLIQDQKEILDDQEQKEIENLNIPEQEKQQLIKARTGQGLYKRNLIKIEQFCRITDVSDLSFLIASHIKPWCKSDNIEKIDGNNGLLLSPHVDKLFDKGIISFSDDGELLIKKEAAKVFADWNLQKKNVGSFNSKQKEYLAFHRNWHKF